MQFCRCTPCSSTAPSSSTLFTTLALAPTWQPGPMMLRFMEALSPIRAPRPTCQQKSWCLGGVKNLDSLEQLPLEGEL